MSHGRDRPAPEELLPRRGRPEAELRAYEAYGLTVAEVDISKMPEANRLRHLTFRKMREIAERS